MDCVAKMIIDVKSPSCAGLQSQFNRLNSKDNCMRKVFAGFIASLILALSSPGQSPLPGTAPLVVEGDPAAAMVEGIHTFLDRETAQSVRTRERFWKRDYASAEAYSRSLSANRERFRKIIGAGDARAPVMEKQLDGTTSTPARVAAGTSCTVLAVRCPC